MKEILNIINELKATAQGSTPEEGGYRVALEEVEIMVKRGDFERWGCGCGGYAQYVYFVSRTELVLFPIT